MTADQESERIKENKNSPAAQKKHKFQPAEWTHPNGHPRCLLCGDEERTGGMCEPVSKSELSKGQNGDWEKEGYKINGTHTELNDDEGFGNFHVHAHAPDGQKIGHFQFFYTPDRENPTKVRNGGWLRVDMSKVDPSHQRKGIANAAYQLAENTIGGKISSTDEDPRIMSDEAKALWNQPNRPFGKSEIELWVDERIKYQPSAKDLIKGKRGDWQSEGYSVSIDHESTWQPKKGIHEFHVVAHSPAGREVGRYTFHHHGNALVAKGADTHEFHQRKGLATEAYRLIENHTGLKVQPDSVQSIAGEALWKQPQRQFGKSEDLSKAINKLEFHDTIDQGKSKTGSASIDHTPHMKLETDHAQYIHDLHHPDKKMPSGLFSEGISPKMVHKMPYGTFMIKPFHEDAVEHSGLATMTAKNVYNAGNISHLNENVSATMLHHPEDPTQKVPVVVSKFHDKATPLKSVPSHMVNPKESAQVCVMDYLMGNNDRHSNNSMIQMGTENAKGELSPLAFDHGFSFSYDDRDENLKNHISHGNAIGGHAKVLMYMGHDHVKQIADWYKDHGDKMHDAMLSSTESVTDPVLRSHIQRNYSDRHKAMKKWAENYKKDDSLNHPTDSFKTVQAVGVDHPTNHGEGAMEDIVNFDAKGGENIHQIKDLFQKHKPTGYNKSLFFKVAARKLHEVHPDALTSYFTEPLDQEDHGGFKNELLHNLVTTGDKHPSHNHLLLGILAENKKHPEGAKPIHPFVQKVMERELHRPEDETFNWNRDDDLVAVNPTKPASKLS